MNNSVNKISFKAQIVTKLSGRHNIMSKVSEDFAHKSRRMTGELNIKRGESLVNPNTLVFSTGEASYVISDYASLMGNNLKNSSDVTGNVVNKISETFLIIFKALKLEDKFVKKNQELIKSISRLKRVIEKNENLLKILEKNNEQTAYKLTSAILDSNKRKLVSLESIYNPQKADFLDEADRLLKKDSILKDWRSVVEDLEI